MSGGREVRWVLVGLLVAVGIAAGLAGAYAQSRREPTLYRAEASFVVERGGQPLPGGAGTEGLVSTFHKLIESNVVAGDVIQNLALGVSASTFEHRLTVKSGGNSAVIQIDVDNGDPGRTTQIAQQIGLVFTQLVSERFGQQTSATVQPLQIAVFDPARLLPGKVSPRLHRDLAWGGLLGLLGGLLVANLAARRRPPKGAVPGVRVLGTAGAAGQVADSLIEISDAQPFQTVAVAGDPDGMVAAAVAHALAERGRITIWMRAADADSAELERLTARCAYVLVAGATVDPELRVDAVVAVTTPATAAATEALVRRPGLRVLGTITANGSEPG